MCDAYPTALFFALWKILVRCPYPGHHSLFLIWVKPGMVWIVLVVSWRCVDSIGFSYLCVVIIRVFKLFDYGKENTGYWRYRW